MEYTEPESIYDDRAILSMLSKNKDYENEPFFQTIITKRYLLLIKFKRQLESWKNFYLRMIHSISLLKEEYGIPYIPHPDFNPTSTIYSEIDLYNTGMIYAAELGKLDLVKYFISKGASDMNRGLTYASRGGQNDVVKFFLARDARDFFWPLKYAALKGHRYLIDLFLSMRQDWDENTINEAMSSAAEGGHRDLVDLFIQKGADDWLQGAIGAAKGGHEDLVDFFISHGVKNRHRYEDVILSSAAKGGHIHLVEKYIKTAGGKDGLEWGVISAAKNGHKNIVELLLKLKIKRDALDSALYDAAEAGYVDIVNLLLANGATDLDFAIRGALKGGQKEIAEMLTRLRAYIPKGSNVDVREVLHKLTKD